jgi:hexulose-6-phosphate isomerase
LSTLHGVRIPSLTGDCFMQAPFWKAEGVARVALERDFRAVISACAAAGIALVIVPLVDNGRIERRGQETALIAFLQAETAALTRSGVRVLFESDFNPTELQRFIALLESRTFGINYDIGNSAASGFDPVEEITAYGPRIGNVHVKDRVRGGTTVPLGTGAADFEAVFSALGRIRYRGNYVLQTARASDGDHASALAAYRASTAEFIRRHAA